MPRRIMFTPKAAKPPATYSQAVKAAALVLVAGTAELTDATTRREPYTCRNLVGPELLSQMTRLSPGQSTSMEWVITEFELRQFNHENVNVLAHVTVRTKVQSEGRAVEVKGSDVLHIVGSSAALDR